MLDGILKRYGKSKAWNMELAVNVIHKFEAFIGLAVKELCLNYLILSVVIKSIFES